MNALKSTWKAIEPYAVSAYCILVSLILMVGWRAVGSNYDLSLLTLLFSFTWPFWGFPHWVCGEFLWGSPIAILLGGPLIGFLIDGLRYFIRSRRRSRIENRAHDR